MKRRKWRPWGWFDLKFFLIQPSGPESVRKYSVGFKFLILSNSFYKWSLFSLLDTVSKENWSILFWKHHYFYFMALFATKLHFKCKQLESAEKYSCWWLMSSSEMRAQLQMANNTSGRQRWWCTLKSPTELTRGHLGQEPGLTWAPLTSAEGHHMGRGAEGLAVGARNLLLAWGDQPNRDCGRTAWAKWKPFVMSSGSEMDEAAADPSFCLWLRAALFLPRLKLVASVWVGFIPEKTFISLGKRPKLIPFRYNLQWPGEAFHAKGNSVHPVTTPSKTLAPLAGMAALLLLPGSRALTFCSPGRGWVSADKVMPGSAPALLSAPPYNFQLTLYQKPIDDCS